MADIQALLTARTDLVLAALILALLGAAGVLTVLVLITRGIGQVRRAVDRLTRGELAQRVTVAGPWPLPALARSLNRMARQLQDRLAAIVQQRNELGAVLWSMVEGVVAVDQDECILSLNRAAADLLNLDAVSAIGRPIQEVIRNPVFQTFVARTLRDGESQQDEITLRSADGPQAAPRILRARSAILHEAGGRGLGAVVVLHDVTRLRRLEAVRRDFVANVSHEIKTPVSAIKAAVETIEDEADLSDADARRFLAMIERQSDRLEAIVHDLLSLARLEEQSGRIAAELECGRLGPVLAHAAQTCAAAVQARRIHVRTRCARSLETRINAPLLEQAMVNLIQNAVKYSPPDTQVVIAAEQADRELVISVADQGAGIGAEHLPRIFERFYRTDRSRGREAGGTGLGLSIVKHVAQAHGGRVSVESTVGRGSVFRIHLPAAASPSLSSAGAGADVEQTARGRQANISPTSSL